MQNDWFSLWPDGLIGIDESGNIVAVSPTAEKLLGWSCDYAQGKSIHQLLCAQNRTHSHTAEDCPLLHEKISVEAFSTLWKHKDGTYISVDSRVLEIPHQEASRIISFVDNEDRLHNQEELQKFAEYVDNTPTPIVEFDSVGQILFGNSSFQELIIRFGFNSDGLAHILPSSIVSICETMTSGNTQDGNHEVDIENHVFQWHFHVLENTDDSTVIGYAFDISEQKRLQKINEEQRSTARKEFYAKMVHELRTPLNAIIGFSDVLLSRSNSSFTEREAHQISMIQQAGKQLNQLVTDTLDVAKIESGKMQIDIDEVSLSKIYAEIHDQIETLARRKNLNFSFSCLTEKTILSDKIKIRQILVNLLSNAVKYTKQGSVHLLVRESHDADLGDCISCTVSDTGVGIPEDQVATLFEAYEQVNEKQNRNIEGTGLGLSLVKNLVQLLEGKITVTSAYGTGSSFEVLLPLAITNQEPTSIASARRASS